jgi:heme A synthase
VVILAAQGGVWGWRAGTAPRLATAALLLSAVVVGVQGWLGWIR